MSPSCPLVSVVVPAYNESENLPELYQQLLVEFDKLDEKLELLVVDDEPSILLAFRRVGWAKLDYDAWSARLLHDQIGFVTPTTWEGETVARLQHPHIAQVFETGQAQGQPFLVLEYVDGPSCQFLLDRTGPLAVRDAARVTLDMAMALDEIDQPGSAR